VVATGRLIVDVQGEDDAVVLEFVRKPAIVQRVVNGQINELCGGGGAEPVPEELRHIGVRGRRFQPDPEDGPHTPPFGVPVVSAEGDAQVQPERPGPAPTSVSSAPSGAPPGSGPGSGATASEIRDRLIELDDLRQRGIISEEEFAAKKAELLSRI
jgi:hypothetical protein